MSLLVVGSVAFDKVETPSGKTGRILGGAGTYISLAASLLTDKISLVSVVGVDFPESYLNLFQSKKIDLTGLKKIPDENTFFWAGRYHRDLNTRETLTTDLNVLANFDPVVPGHARNSRFLMLGNLTPSIQKKVILQMETRPALIAMDTMNFWMNTTWDDLVDVLTMVDALLVNDEEARQLSGEYSIKKAAQKILQMGPKFLIIKKGEHGAILFDKNQSFHAPAFLLDHVVDPTGAGDTFAGGFMGYLAKNNQVTFHALKNAMVFGSVLASFAVEKFGTDNLLDISMPDIEKRVEEFVRLVHFEL